MYSHYAFVSESGNYILNFDEAAATDFFVVSAILVERENLATIDQMLADIPFEYVPQKTITDRETILSKLLSIDFQLYSIVIDKKKLLLDGGHSNLKLTFEYINETIFQALIESRYDIQIYIVQKETPFTNSFKTHINERHQPNLFNQSIFMGRSNLTTKYIVPLSKFMNDTIWYAYEHDRSLLNKLATKFIRLEKYPLFNIELNTDNQLDHLIATQAILIAQNYIKKHHKSDVAVTIDQVNFLKFLLTQLAIKPNKYIYSQVIINNMKTFSTDIISKEHLMKEIIGPLRDAGVLIASTSKGYKIPTSRQDLIDYVEFGSSMALPILRRLEKGRRKVLEITENELDIFEDDEFAELREIMGLEITAKEY